MKPEHIKSKIFLDSGDPHETREILSLLGFLDGQTTNPSLVAKNPDIQKEIAESGHKLTEARVYEDYKNIVREISGLVPQGSVSIEVYGDHDTTADAMFAQGQDMFTWIPNAHVKYPILKAGLEAAEKSIAAGMRVNMTLCFTEEQGAAVYAATRGAKKGDVFVSPFVGRFDDRGENGMSFIANMVRMYKGGDGHTEIISASVRTFEHFMCSLAVGADIITAPFKVLKEWGEKGMPIP
ncbi:MAG: transaldolase family protein, partial [Minisyncoccia bacterium]